MHAKWDICYYKNESMKNIQLVFQFQFIFIIASNVQIN